MTNQNIAAPPYDTLPINGMKKIEIGEKLNKRLKSRIPNSYFPFEF